MQEEKYQAVCTNVRESVYLYQTWQIFLVYKVHLSEASPG